MIRLLNKYQETLKTVCDERMEWSHWIRSDEHCGEDYIWSRQKGLKWIVVGC